MPLRVRAINPTPAPPIDTRAPGLVAGELGPAPIGFAGEMIRRMADYPGQRETVSGYIRTGDLGRGWKMERFRRTANTLSVDVVNRVGYAGHVQGRKRGRKGERQTREMRRRGWPNIEDTTRNVWRIFRPRVIRILSQRDPRLRRRERRRRFG